MGSLQARMDQSARVMQAACRNNWSRIPFGEPIEPNCLTKAFMCCNFDIHRFVRWIEALLSCVEERDLRTNSVPALYKRAKVKEEDSLGKTGHCKWFVDFLWCYTGAKATVCTVLWWFTHILSLKDKALDLFMLKASVDFFSVLIKTWP